MKGYIVAVFLGLAAGGFVCADETGKLAPDAGKVVQGNSEFACRLYAKLASQEGNLFFSPYGISNALAMTYAGARGKTAEEMAVALNFALAPDRLQAGWAEVIRELSGPGRKRAYQLNIANRLWGLKDYGFLPQFLKITQDNY